MNYSETLAFLYQQLPMYQRQGKSAFKKDLTNTYLLLDRLNNPQKDFRSVHIAGTNGKGSSAYALESMLRAANYKVGLYTSPHLRDFTERVQVNSDAISQGNVVDFVAMLQQAVKEIQPSFFELTVAMAFWYFAKVEVDIAVVETGLGGRLDSTNVITPLVSLITMIGWDHADLLGDTLEKIAGEKAGIIKANVPVVIGADQPDLLPIFEDKARREGSAMIAHRRDYHWEIKERDIARQVIDLYKGGKLIHEDLVVSNGADYLLENLPGVLDVVDVLNTQGFSIGVDHIRVGLETLTLPGRWQVMGSQPTVVADVSHNAAGLNYLMSQVSREIGSKHIVFGMVKDKDTLDLLRLLPRDAQFYWTQSSVPRTLPANELAEQAKRLGLDGDVFSNVKVAIDAARKNADSEDIILICGSTFVVAEIPEL